MKSYIKNYPRPQLVRQSWGNLNGSWKFLFDDADCGESKKWYDTFPEDHKEIQVPFTYETKLSGIGDTTEHRQVWYERSVTVEQEDLENKKVFLHFEGSDFITKVWVNGIYIGLHRGAYARFSFDITKPLKIGSNKITVKIEDSPSIEQPRGKQRWQKDNFGCWYIQTTGIWKTVWMESVPEVYLSGLKMTPDVENGKIDLIYEVEAGELTEDLQIEAEISFEDTIIQNSVKKIQRKKVSDTISVFYPEETPWAVHLWSPDEPELYDLRIRIMKGSVVVDEVLSYFGMREVRIDNGNILLNGSPLYQRLILDQGYWEETHLTPPSEEALIDDIDKIHALGYNGLRKHMKTEDERFLYWCDVKGMLVWSEMAATYEFSDAAVEEFTKEWFEVVRQNYNHPSIITWTPFNESWGIPKVKFNRKQQHFTEGIYYLTKSIDSMRPVILNDGWEHTNSDIITLHDYEEDGEVFYDRYADHLEDIMTSRIYHSGSKCALADGYAYHGKPVIISEFGGIAFKSDKADDWGYGNMVSTEEEFLERFDKITTAIKKIPYVVGYCYTQVSDVQQEVNGLLDPNHEYKIAPEKIREINETPVGIHRAEMTR